MKKIIKYLFPKKTKWVDIGCYDSSGKYKLLQMRTYLDTDKKEFRTVSLGFINDWTIKESIFKKILEKEQNGRHNNV